MIALGEHAEFIIGAYVGVSLGLAALIGWTLLDRRRVNRRLDALADKRR